MNAAANEARDQDALVETEVSETKMTYGEGKLPWLVVAVWVCALSGLGVYLASYLIPELALWGRP